MTLLSRIKERERKIDLRQGETEKVDRPDCVTTSTDVSKGKKKTRKMERRVCPIKSASNVRCSRVCLHIKKKVAVDANRRKEVEYRYL